MSLDREIAAYQARSPRSRALHEEAARVMPGGNSRTTTFFDPYPFYLARGEGARMWDADGVERLDFNGNYTSLVLGPAPAPVVKAIQEAARPEPRSRVRPSTRSGSRRRSSGASPRSRPCASLTRGPRPP